MRINCKVQARKKRAEHKPHARLDYSQIALEIAAYLFVEAGGGALVAGAELVEESLLQPVSIIPIARPSSTIRVYILFIVTRNFYQNPNPDKKILSIKSHVVFPISQASFFSFRHELFGQFNQVQVLR